jgi:U3 small nucleolar RNA-associated protein 14
MPAAPKRSRTSAHHFSLSKDEAGPSTRRRRDDEDEDEDAAMEERIRQVAMRIAGDELLDLDESEESDVDSDAAWEIDGSDEERWGDVFRDLNKGKGKKGKSKAQDVVKKVRPDLQALTRCS